MTRRSTASQEIGRLSEEQARAYLESIRWPVRALQLTRSRCPSRATGVSSSFGSALLDAEIRFRAPITVADMLRAALLARREPHEPIWRGLERLLEHARAYWLALPKHRDPVFARDGWRCSVPGCSSRRNLHDHHVKFRSQGGGGEQDNRVAVCASHHQHGIHRFVVRARGKAGVGLDWELGRRGANGPLLTIAGRGEVYVPARDDAASLDWVRFVPAESAAYGTRLGW